jgi:hypothetical protein
VHKKSTQANAGACAQQSRERKKIKERFSDNTFSSCGIVSYRFTPSDAA